VYQDAVTFMLLFQARAYNQFMQGPDPLPDEFAAARRTMVEEQIRKRGVSAPRVLEAMLRVPRHEFVPAEFRSEAYADKPLPIGEGQTISQPYMVAAMTEALELSGSERVLEIGTGSGYQAAVLSLLAREVISVESQTSLALSPRNVSRTWVTRTFTSTTEMVPWAFLTLPHTTQFWSPRLRRKFRGCLRTSFKREAAW
jgi:hypothetical protein